MHVEIKSTALDRERTGNNGKTYGNQEAALFCPGSDYPLAFVINVEKGREDAPGIYDVTRSSFGTNKFGELALSRVQLRLREAAAAPLRKAS